MSGFAYVVDQDEDDRQAIRALVSSVGIDCKTFETAESFMGVDTESRPSVVILEVRLPDSGGLEIQQNLLIKGAAAPMIFLTAYGDVWTAVQAMKHGAFDFLEKPFRGQELLTSVQGAIRHHTEILKTRKRKQELDALVQHLTPREVDVLIRLGAGKSNKIAADELGLSIRTIEFHRANLMHKLHANSRETVIQLAHELLRARFHPDTPQ